MRLAATLLACTLFAAPVLGQTWRTGAEFNRQWEAPVNVTWEGRSLRAGVKSLSTSLRVGMLIDRRLDPSAELSLRLEEVPLEESLKRIAASVGAGVCREGPMVYFAPKDTAERFATVVAIRHGDLRPFPGTVRSRWTRKQAWQWEDLTEPAKLLAELAQQGRFEIANPERMPHDLWAAADLPPLTLVQRLSLMLAQFDLTFRIENGGSRVVLAAMPEQVSIERRYPAGSQPQERLRRWRELAPDAEIQREGNQIVVRGRAEDLARLQSGNSSTPRRTTVESDKRYTLNVKNKPLLAVLNYLCKELGLTLKADAEAWKEAGIDPNQLVSFQVREADRRELFEAVFKQTKLSHRIAGDVLEVSVK